MPAHPSTPRAPRPLPDNKKRREKLRRALQRVNVPERSWRSAKAALTEQWHRREISNFEYLMELNTLAGRSFADLNQYPVFPWILSDYTSDRVDLNDHSIYRDLSKPVGALNPERLAQVIERYESMGDADMPRFHYGSHYSSAGATLFWLLRLEPYTSYAIDLQSGRFDHADRLFYSLEEAWNSCNTSLADVKELIPEFFYLPDFLVNRSRFQLGVRQDGKQVDDVKLPPWAANAEQFVTMHRRALESEHVRAVPTPHFSTDDCHPISPRCPPHPRLAPPSAPQTSPTDHAYHPPTAGLPSTHRRHARGRLQVSASLHLWIDLIFGAKQRLPASEAAANVFFYLTYEGEFDLENISDEGEREAMRTQVTPRAPLPRAPHARTGFARPTSLRSFNLPQLYPARRGHTPSLTSHFAPVAAPVHPRHPLPLHPLFPLHPFHPLSPFHPMRSQVACFGQTPPQLFTSPHPPRRAALPFLRPVHWGPVAGSTCRPFVRVPLKHLATQGQQTGRALALSAITVVGEADKKRALAIDASSTAHWFRWPPQAGRAPQVTSARRHCSTQLPASDSSKSSCVALLDAAPLNGSGVFVLTGGHFDGALCVSSEAGRTVHVHDEHSRSITCVALSANGSLLLTGAADTTVVLWEMQASGQAHPLKTLRGHVRELTAVALSFELSIAASGAADGCVLLHTTHNGSLVRSISHPSKQPIGHLLLSAIHARLVIGASTTVRAHRGSPRHQLMSTGGLLASS